MARLYPALACRWPASPPAAELDRLLAFLDDHSPTAVEETPDGLRVFFATAPARDRALAAAASFDPAVTVAAIEVSDEDWAERSQSSLEPVQVGRFVIVPRKDLGSRFPQGSTRETTPDVLFTLFILPSMGFGTGHHASTRLCLRLLQARPLTGASVLDVGTGSGVLAIAARKLGAAVVIATDIDRDALQSAQDNLDLNQERGVRLEEIDLAAAPAGLGRRFDVVLANLTGAVLMREAGALAALAEPGGSLIASGFQPHEAGEVVSALDRAGWSLASRLDEQEWVGAAFEARAAATNPTHSTAR
jgi:ribosomal protein L11 methyltransferase